MGIYPNDEIKEVREMYFFPREGVIIECPQNGLYHNPHDVSITSQMAVSQIWPGIELNTTKTEILRIGDLKCQNFIIFLLNPGKIVN